MLLSPRSKIGPTVVFLICLLIPTGLPRWSWAAGELELKERFFTLKEHLENASLESDDPAVISCLAVETAAMAWLLAVAELMDEEETRREWLAKANDFQESWEASRNWEARHLAALENYYDALSELTIFLISENNQKPLAGEWQRIREKTKRQLTEMSQKTDSVLEKKVILSGALVGLSSIIVRSVGGGPMTRPVREKISELMDNAQEINKRPDLHYRAKLSLLYAGNLQGLTAMTFILGMNAGPPLSEKLAILHGTLNKYGPGSSLAQALGLTWTAQAQASVPLAYWLAGRASNKPGQAANEK